MNIIKRLFKNKALILLLLSIMFLMIVNIFIKKRIHSLSERFVYINERSLENINKNYISKELRNKEKGFDHIHSKMTGKDISQNTIEEYYKLWEDYMIYNDEISYLYLGNNEGEIYVRPEYTVGDGFVVEERPWYQAALKNKDKKSWLIYKEYKSKISQLCISKQIDLGGGKIGVLGMDISTSQISSYLSEIVKESKNESVFLMSDQMLIYEELNNPQIDKNILLEIRNKSKDRKAGFFKEGKWYVFYSPIYIDGWNLVKAIDRSEIEGELNSYMQLAKLFFFLQITIVISGLFHLLHKVRYSHARDPLTGLFNRGLLNKILLKSDRKNLEYSIIFLDIDNFKKINDTYGHQVGDVVLKRIGEVIKNLMDKKNHAYRYGGEEFVIYSLLDKYEVYQLGEDIRKEVENLKWREGFKVTISLGIKVAKNEKSFNVLKRADELLYQSKTSGKNKVSFEV